MYYDRKEKVYKCEECFYQLESNNMSCGKKKGKKK